MNNKISVTIIKISLLLLLALVVLCFLLSLSLSNALFILSYWTLMTFLSIVSLLQIQKLIIQKSGMIMSVLLANGFAKMLLCVFIFTFYLVIYKPINKTFVLPFMLIYAVFAIFETYYLVQLMTKNK